MKDCIFQTLKVSELVIKKSDKISAICWRPVIADFRSFKTSGTDIRLYIKYKKCRDIGSIPSKNIADLVNRTQI